ncbi:MAG: Mrp/NBP35 family ATP-binding protein [Acidimicrobiales bacterium]
MPPDAPVPSQEEIRTALRAVIDPELHADIVELGMVRDVLIGPDGDVTVRVALTIAGCPLLAQIRRDVQARVQALPGVRSARVEFAEMTQEQRSELMVRARRRAAENAPATEVPLTTRVVAVASGKGGVGKSSVTVNLAAALAARGAVVGVLDADVWGFSVPRMLGVGGERLGAEKAEGVAAGDGPEVAILPNQIPIGAKGGRLKVVSMGLVVEDEDQAIMWRGLLLAKAVEEFLVKVRWGDLDFLLIDMPPGTGDVQMALGRLLPRAEMVVVTTPAGAARRVATRVADMARRSSLHVLGVVENMSGFTCDHGETYPLFGAGGGEELARDLGVPLLAQVPLEAAVGVANDAGTPLSIAQPDSPAGAVFAALAARVAEELLPPVDMAGCSVRLLDAIEDALGPSPARR